MIRKHVEYETVGVTNIIIDEDNEMSWISQFDSHKYDRFHVFIDSNVDDIWGNTVRAQLKCHNKDIFVFRVEPTEKCKSLLYYPEVIAFLESNTATRHDLVLAVGGGIVIDLISFSASTYMRGLPFVAIPTTLIGQVDATTAGKTCLNTEKCKNLLGTFYYPEVVYNNLHFLRTNSDRHQRQGYSEVLKYGLLASRRLINLLCAYIESPNQGALRDMIDLTIEIRIAIRKKDPLASNLGHTFGHAIEKMSDSAILHGDAIAIGTVMAISFAEQEGIFRQGVKDEVLRMMKRIGLNVYVDSYFDADKMFDLMKRDKKSSSDKFNLVLLEDIEKPYEKNGNMFYNVDMYKVHAFIRKFLDDYEYRMLNLSRYLEREKISYQKESA